MRSRHLLLVMVVVCVIVGVCAFAVSRSGLVASMPGSAESATAPVRTSQRPEPSQPSASTITPSDPRVHDITHLLRPTRNYLGLAMAGAPRSMDGVQDFAARTSLRP